DDGLGGEVLKQLNLFFGKRPHLLAVDDVGADELVVLEHRDCDNGTRAAIFGGWHRYRVQLRVKNLGDDLLAKHAAEHVVPILWIERPALCLKFDKLTRGADPGDEM